MVLVSGFRLRAVLLALVHLGSTLSEAFFPIALGVSVTAITAGDTRGLVVAGAFLVVLIGVRVGLSISALVLSKRLEIELSLRLKSAIGERVVVAESGFEVGEILEVASADTGTLGRAYGVFDSVVVSVIVFVVVAAILLAQSVVLGLVILAAVPVLVLGLPLILRPLTARLSEHRDLAGAVSELSADVAVGLKTLKGLGAETVFFDRFRRVSARMQVTGLRVARLRAFVEGIKIVVPAAVILTVLAVGLVQLRHGEITTGQLVAFYGLAIFLVGPVTRIVDSVQEIGPLFVASDRVWSVLYSDDRTERDVGTLCDSFAINSVTVLPENHPAADIARVAHGSGILVCRGDDYLFEGSVREMFLGTPDEVTMRRALDVAHATDIVTELGGLDGRIEDAGANLSGGQRQRCVLARAIAADPDLLVLVNPTSAVDTVTEWGIAHRVIAARSGKTTVIVTNSPAFTSAAESVRDQAGVEEVHL